MPAGTPVCVECFVVILRFCIVFDCWIVARVGDQPGVSGRNSLPLSGTLGPGSSRLWLGQNVGHPILSRLGSSELRFRSTWGRRVHLSALLEVAFKCLVLKPNHFECH